MGGSAVVRGWSENLEPSRVCATCDLRRANSNSQLIQEQRSLVYVCSPRTDVGVCSSPGLWLVQCTGVVSNPPAAIDQSNVCELGEHCTHDAADFSGTLHTHTFAAARDVPRLVENCASDKTTVFSTDLSAVD